MSEDQAEKLAEDTTEDEEVTNPEDEQELDAEQDAGEGEGEEPEKEEDSDESGEVELVRDVKGSQPTKLTRSFSHRIKKFKGETQQEKDRADGAESENAILREQLKLKDIALEQAKNQKPPVARPNPDDFDEGGSDPKYLTQLDGFYDQRAKQIAAEQIAEARKTQTKTVSRVTEDNTLDANLDKYMQTAEKVCPKDRETKENEAIRILGQKTVVDIIKIWEDDAPLIIYALGTEKNKDEAEIIRDLAAKDPAKGMLRIERLLTEISFKPKTKKTAPEPDDELPGGTASGGKRGPKGATFT